VMMAAVVPSKFLSAAVTEGVTAFGVTLAVPVGVPPVRT